MASTSSLTAFKTSAVQDSFNAHQPAQRLSSASVQAVQTHQHGNMPLEAVAFNQHPLQHGAESVDVTALLSLPVADQAKAAEEYLLIPGLPSLSDASLPSSSASYQPEPGKLSDGLEKEIEYIEKLLKKVLSYWDQLTPTLSDFYSGLRKQDAGVPIHAPGYGASALGTPKGSSAIVSNESADLLNNRTENNPTGQVEPEPKWSPSPASLKADAEETTASGFDIDLDDEKVVAMSPHKDEDRGIISDLAEKIAEFRKSKALSESEKDELWQVIIQSSSQENPSEEEIKRIFATLCRRLLEQVLNSNNFAVLMLKTLEQRLARLVQNLATLNEAKENQAENVTVSTGLNAHLEPPDQKAGVNQILVSKQGKYDHYLESIMPLPSADAAPQKTSAFAKALPALIKAIDLEVRSFSQEISRSPEAAPRKLLSRKTLRDIAAFVTSTIELDKEMRNQFPARHRVHSKGDEDWDLERNTFKGNLHRLKSALNLTSRKAGAYAELSLNDNNKAYFETSRFGPSLTTWHVCHYLLDAGATPLQVFAWAAAQAADWDLERDAKYCDKSVRSLGVNRRGVHKLIEVLMVLPHGLERKAADGSDRFVGPFQGDPVVPLVRGILQMERDEPTSCGLTPSHESGPCIGPVSTTMGSSQFSVEAEPSFHRKQQPQPQPQPQPQEIEMARLN